MTLRVVIKSAAIIPILICSIIMISSGQANYVDSLKIATERTKISTELSQLRESIKQSSYLLTSASKKAKVKNAKKLEASAQELTRYGDQTKVLIDEVTATSPNGWSDINLNRIRSSQSVVRLNYYRLEKSSAKLIRKKARKRSSAAI
jgi:hypothetical protein